MSDKSVLYMFEIGSEDGIGISYRYVISTDEELVEAHLKPNEFIDTHIPIKYMSDIAGLDIDILIPAKDLALNGTISEGYVSLK